MSFSSPYSDFYRPTLCADLGGTFIKFARSTSAGVLETQTKVPMPAHDWPAFVAALDALCQQTGTAGEPLGISTAGLVDVDSDHVFASNIPAFQGHQFVAELSAALHRPVRVANDADCFVLAEAFMGVAQGHRIVFGLILGSGVGGGLIVNGQLVQGVGGISGEWGHAPMAKTSVCLPGESEPIEVPRFHCGCGQTGCLDTIGGARGLERLHQALAADQHQPAMNSRDIVSGWMTGEPTTSRTVAVYLEMMAEPLAMIANLTGASCMPVGGGLAGATALIAALDARVRPLTLRHSSSPVIVPGQFVAEGGLLGASVLAQLSS